MAKSTRLMLDPSETAVVHAASRIFSAYVASGQVTDESEEAMMTQAIDLAVKLALETDKKVISDMEVS